MKCGHALISSSARNNARLKMTSLHSRFLIRAGSLSTSSRFIRPLRAYASEKTNMIDSAPNLMILPVRPNSEYSFLLSFTILQLGSRDSIYSVSRCDK